jgi:23S rRNA (cytosine1962-C5)-methyltransferase
VPPPVAYQLIDFGGAARLERFGERLVDRPHPGALGSRADPELWRDADLRFDRDRGWGGPADGAGAWSFEHERLRLELRPTDAGQVGLFPEHLDMLPWLRQQVEAQATGDAGADAGPGSDPSPGSDANLRSDARSPSVLHLFAYTGLATLAMATAGASVTHVDASKPTVTWARRNAGLSDLADRPIRWIVDDAVDFTSREARRGHRYDGIVLDPPSYGHGPGARPWRLEEDLAALLDACGAVLRPGGFVLLTAHTPGFDADRLAELVAGTVGASRRDVEGGHLGVATEDGRELELGAFARLAGGA